MNLVLIICVALLLDAVLGEPRRGHPLVAFGNMVKYVEKTLYADSVLRGSFATCAVLALPLTAALLLQQLSQPLVSFLLQAGLLYLAIGWQSLNSHAETVRKALASADLSLARQRTGMLVSRDTQQLTEEQVCAATVESVLENGNDAIFAAIFWFVIAGIPGVVLYRLVNTLDAMWGYRSSRYLRFGRFAARFDDVMNYVPARLTALSYALCGSTRRALCCWRQQAGKWKSPNAGPVMAAGAGALEIELGGAASYHGQNQMRPALGEGRAPLAGDIHAAQRLIKRALLLWLLVLLAVMWALTFVMTKSFL